MTETVRFSASSRGRASASGSTASGGLGIAARWAGPLTRAAWRHRVCWRQTKTKKRTRQICRESSFWAPGFLRFHAALLMWGGPTPPDALGFREKRNRQAQEPEAQLPVSDLSKAPARLADCRGQEPRNFQAENGEPQSAVQQCGCSWELLIKNGEQQSAVRQCYCCSNKNPTCRSCR